MLTAVGMIIVGIILWILGVKLPIEPIVNKALAIIGAILFFVGIVILVLGLFGIPVFQLK